jgi:UDP-GlcNAc:undecaprenyl-phosphate GlcNAc-1-phosphate transferase
MTVAMLSLLGALSGFLVFNFNPAKIFMGDCGSLFIGFYIAASSVLNVSKINTFVSLALPLLALGIPIFDTLFSMLRRFLERRSLFAPDSSHFHHVLVAFGLHHRHVVIIMYIITLLISGLGFFMLFSHNFQSIIIFANILILLILAFRILGVIRLRDTILGLQQKFVVMTQMKQEKQRYEEIELHFRQAKDFKQWWNAVCFSAEQMNVASLLLSLPLREGTHDTLTWKRSDNIMVSGDLVKINIPIPDRRKDSLLNLELKVQINGSLESAGRRISFLARLLEKYNIYNLNR